MMQISISNVIGSRSKSAPTLGEFISVWDTGGLLSIQLPLVPSGNYNFSVNWGDGNTDTITAYNQAEVLHNYATPGIYTITITGTIEGWSFLGGGDAVKLTSITNIGPLKLGNDGLYFSGCSNLTTIGGTFDLTGTTDFGGMFNGCTSLTSVNGISSWDVSAVTNMANMFGEATSFNQPLNSWDVSAVTNMANMFGEATSFNQPLNSWDVSAVTNMGSMFGEATSFNQPLNSWNTSAVTDMASMFDTATAFNQDISGWDVSSVTGMSGMFNLATSFNQDISAWDISNVVDLDGFMTGKSTADYSYYDDLLNAWSLLTLQNGVTWGMGTIEYTSAGATARQDIIDNYSWTINDGGLLLDPEAQAFITAAAITDPTQQSAINQLVLDLKGYSIWTKMKAIYPMVGGTSSTHKWNLKDPRDLDAAFRLVFNGGWTHSVNGALPNGTNAYAETYLNDLSNLAQNSAHISVYSRTNAGGLLISIGSNTYGQSGGTKLTLNYASQTYYSIHSANQNNSSNTDTRGMFIGNRTASTGTSLMIRGTITTHLENSQTPSNTTFKIGGIGSYFDNKELAFATIGDGLTNTDMTNLTTAVQTFQTTLGRSIGTQTVSDADAQAFVTNAGIVDQVEANAINNLVIGLKADSLWTKMKALYPFVGGSSSTMKYNLKNPLDTDAAFRLTYNGGLTYSSTGLLGGVNGYADTKLSPSTSLSLDNTHISFYSRTDTSTTENVEMGINDIANNSRLFIAPKFSGANSSYRAVNSAQAGAGASPNMQGFFIASRVNSTAMKLYRNASVLFNDSTSSGVLNSSNIFLLCYNSTGTPLYYTDRECAFASIGDGLTDTEATNFYNRVQTFNTSLARQV